MFQERLVVNDISAIPAIPAIWSLTKSIKELNIEGRPTKSTDITAISAISAIPAIWSLTKV